MNNALTCKVWPEPIFLDSSTINGIPKPLNSFANHKPVIPAPTIIFIISSYEIAIKLNSIFAIITHNNNSVFTYSLSIKLFFMNDSFFACLRSLIIISSIKSSIEYLGFQPKIFFAKLESPSKLSTSVGLKYLLSTFTI